MSGSRGVCYVAYGDNAEREANLSIASLRRYCNYPVAIANDKTALVPMPANGELTNAQKSRWAKVNLDAWSPFDLSLYLDADTRVNGSVLAGFDIMQDGYDMAMTPSSNQGGECLWHVDKRERDDTLLELGREPLQLQAGVMFFRKTERTNQLFATWKSEWLRWKGQDQAALLRAMQQVPVKLHLLGRPWNGGAIIAHLFGRARQ